MATGSRIEIVQNCYVVRDLEAACARLHRQYGIGPFVGGSEGVLGDHFYRGAAAEPIRIRGVFVQSGSLNIELVQVLSTGPSAFRDMYSGDAEGFHHTAVFCDDYAQTRDAWTAEGYALASEFVTSFGARICYLDARATHGHMIELYPEHEVIREMYGKARRAANDWDGQRLIVPWADVA
ncbi:VOC family protein [Novosphingobium tardum]|uniref:VOC family protein n=1 Tax=Novosphingobium tardum TaxID=1538021 RepID=A0ABV8RS87_9SPHN